MESHLLSCKDSGRFRLTATSEVVVSHDSSNDSTKCIVSSPGPRQSHKETQNCSTVSTPLPNGAFYQIYLSGSGRLLHFDYTKTFYLCVDISPHTQKRTIRSPLADRFADPFAAGTSADHQGQHIPLPLRGSFLPFKGRHHPAQTCTQPKCAQSPK